MENKRKSPSFGYSALVLVAMIVFMLVGLLVFDAKLTLLFFLAWLLLLPAIMKLGYSYDEIEKWTFDMARKGFQPIAILLGVGAIIGAWIASGTVPALIYYGLKFISPGYFLLAAMVLCSLTSLAVGTGWGTLGTSGLAMMGVGAGLGVPPAITAGAVICGASLGDKMSPLSDSTNLAPAVAGSDLVSHIKHMLYTTTPAYIIAAVLFSIIGLKYTGQELDTNNINAILQTLDANFNISIIEFLPCAFLFVLLARRKPALPSILASAVFGSVLAVMRQGVAVNQVVKYMYSGYTIESEMNFINTLLNRGGIMDFANTVLLMMFSFFAAALLNESGILKTLLDPVTKKIGDSTGKLVATSVILGIINNAIGCSQSFSIVMTGTLMRPLYEEFKLKPENLSRVLEDSGSLTAMLVPWNINGIFATSMLGVSTIYYAPYCFLNWITPIISIIYGITGFSMTKIESNAEA